MFLFLSPVYDVHMVFHNRIELTYYTIFYSRMTKWNWTIKQFHCDILSMYIYTYPFYSSIPIWIITFFGVCTKLKITFSHVRTRSNHYKLIVKFYSLLTYSFKSAVKILNNNCITIWLNIITTFHPNTEIWLVR